MAYIDCVMAFGGLDEGVVLPLVTGVLLGAGTGFPLAAPPVPRVPNTLLVIADPPPGCVMGLLLTEVTLT